MLGLIGLSLAATIEVKPGDDIVALTASLAAGSEVAFAPGVYTIDRTLQWSGAGTEAAPIRLRGAPGAIIEASAGNPIVRVEAAAHLVIEGLTLRGSEAWATSGDHFTGLQIDDSADITVRDVVVTRTGGTALALTGDNERIVVEAVELSHTTDGHGVYVGCWDASCWTRDSALRTLWIHDLGGEGAMGVIFDAGTQGTTLADSVIHGMISRGVQVESTEFGPANVIERNAIYATGDGIGVHGAAFVRNNVIFDTTDEGIRSHPMDGRAIQDVVISHNTVVRTASWALEIDDWNGATGMVVANNAFANPTGYGVRATDAELEGAGWFSHNVVTGLVDGLADRPDAALPGGGYTDFADADGLDFYPRRSGALWNAGATDAEAQIPSDDFHGLARPSGAPDVGALAWVGEENPGGPIAPGLRGPVEAPDPNDAVGGCGGDRASAWAPAVLLLLGLRSPRRRALPSGSGCTPRGA